MFDIGWSEFLFLAVLVLIVVGPQELPGLMRRLGQMTSALLNWPQATFASKIEIKDKNSSFINNIKVNARLNSWANLDLSHSLEKTNYDYSYYKPYDTWAIGSGGDNDYGLVYSEGALIKRSTNSNQKQTQVTLNLSQDKITMAISSFFIKILL